MSKSRNRIYTNGEITIFWCAPECQHATTCFAELRTVFDPAKRPWINPNGASSEEIKRIIEKCPTRALTFRWNDESRNAEEKSPKLFVADVEGFLEKTAKLNNTDDEPQIADTTITIRPNGPVVASGEFTVIDENGKPLRKMKMMSLCRCGKSSGQPFCDGTHFASGFHD